MDLSAILLFATVIAIATATPGPSLLTLIARVLSIGPARNIGFAIGLVLGDVLWLGAAAFGLSAIAAQAHEVMAVLKYVGAAYLLYLAYKMWMAPTDGVIASAGPRRLRWSSVAGGLAMAVSNPKTMLFYLALLPTIIDLNGITAFGLLQLALTMLVVLAAVDIA